MTITTLSPILAAAFAVATRFTPEAELAPKDENETQDDHALRLLSAIVDSEPVDSGRDEHIAQLENELAAVKAKLAKASTAAKAKPAQGRKVGPKLESFDPAELADLIALADSVELVALDAKHREIAGFTQALSGGAGAWRVAGNGLRLALPEGLPLSAPEGGQSAIHAWGLVLDGKPAAFAARFEPLVLGAGQMTNLGDDVIF